MSNDITSVPYLRLQKEFDAVHQQWFERITSLGASGAFILGPEVAAFEQEAAQYVGVKHAIAVANGTDALILSLRALNIGEGDEVITSPFTFFATAEAISMVGATPVFADINQHDFNLDAVSVEQKITPKTKAIMPVHIFGCPADMTALKAIADQHKLYLVEDSAQAFGAEHDGKKVCSLGDLGCVSFYPTKVLGCYGDGGLITTNSDELKEHLLKLRNHGAVKPFVHDELAYNSRLDAVQAALLRIKLPRLDDDINARRQVADWYRRELEGTDAICPADGDNNRHAYNLFTIRHPRRSVLRALLNENKVGNSQCYPEPLSMQPVYAHLGYKTGDLPVVEALCDETLSLPIYPDLSEAEVVFICDLLKTV